MSAKYTNVICYCRVSTQEQAMSGYSLQEQEDRMAKYAEAMGWRIRRTISDPGFSGAKTDRPGLRELLSEIHAGNCDAVLVWKLDRLSRSQKDTLYLIEDEFLPNDVAFVSMNENFDTSTPFGRAMIGILSVFAQLEREQIKERMQLGHDARAKSGKFHGSARPPIGYDYIDGKLYINEYEAQQIQEMFDLFVNHHWSYYKILKRFQDCGYTTKYGNWIAHSTIQYILSNPLYIGKLQYKGNIYDGIHEPLIDEETFARAQERMKHLTASVEDPYRRHPFQAKYLLSGHLFCGNCGARMFVYRSKTTIRGKTYQHRYYKCYSRDGRTRHMVKDKSCKMRNIRVDQLDTIVLDEIRRLSLDKEYFRSLVTAPVKPDNKNDILQGRIKELSDQVERLIDLCKIGSMPVAKIAAQIEQAQTEMDRLTAQIQPESPVVDVVKQAELILDNAIEVIDNGTLEEKRQLIDGLIDKIIIYEDRFEIRWIFSPE